MVVNTLDFIYKKLSNDKKTIKDDIMTEYGKLSIRNRIILNEYELCGCCFCEEIFKTDMIDVYVDPGEVSALCPFCYVDSVIPIHIDDFNENHEECKELC